MAQLYTIMRFLKSYICFLAQKWLLSVKSIYAMAFIEIVYIKLPSLSLKAKDEYIRFPKAAFRIHSMQLFRFKYPKIDMYDFGKRLIVYIVTVLTELGAENSIHKIPFFKIVYSFQLFPSFPILRNVQ
ncbi:MAG TPA: hypothetical protein DD632_00465 [Oribacterium sp.]|nr:hypothetical protein [Oribacterium sp.]